MTDRAPAETKNLDGYGNPPIAWSRVHDELAIVPMPTEVPFFLSTVRPNGRPHSAGIGAIWYEGDLYITANPETRKARNLQLNPFCTITTRLKTVDLVLEGEVTRVTDAEMLAKLAKEYRDGGWPAEVEGDAFTAPFSAPSAGKPPYYVYRFTFDTVFAVSIVEPGGATRWRFGR